MMRVTKKVQRQKKLKEKPTGGAPLREMIMIDDASVVGAKMSPADPQLSGNLEGPSDSPWLQKKVLFNTRTRERQKPCP